MTILVLSPRYSTTQSCRERRRKPDVRPIAGLLPAFVFLAGLLCQPSGAAALPKAKGKMMCDCICASDAQDPSSHLPLWTGDVSFEAEYGSCGGDLGDCAVKDSGGHSVPGRLHSCSSRTVTTKLGTVQVGPMTPVKPKKKHP